MASRLYIAKCRQVADTTSSFRHISGDSPATRRLKKHLLLPRAASTNTPANPAAAGSIVVIYCVGGGVTNPPSADGAILGVPAPVLAQQPVTVTIGGTNSQVLYSGAVAYSIAGLTQINAVVPPGLTAHGQVPVVVSIGGVQSQSGVTVALQ